MSTRSTIWFKDADKNKWIGIYCHHDGYLEHNGKILYEYYNDIHKIKSLMDLGGISFLGKDLNPENTYAYHRDKKEELVYYECEDFKDTLKYHEEYNYYYVDSTWFIWNGSKLESLYVKLVEKGIIPRSDIKNTNLKLTYPKNNCEDEIELLESILKKWKVEIKFIKKNGEERIMFCTMNKLILENIEEYKQFINKKKEKDNKLEEKPSVKKDFLVVWDLEKNGWRRINPNSIKEIKINFNGESIQK